MRWGEGGCPRRELIKPFSRAQSLHFVLDQHVHRAGLSKPPSAQIWLKKGTSCFFFFYLLAVLFSDAPGPMTFQLTIASLSSEQSWLVSAHHTGLVECVFCMQCDSRVRLQSVSFVFLFFLWAWLQPRALGDPSYLLPWASLCVCMCVCSQRYQPRCHPIISTQGDSCWAPGEPPSLRPGALQVLFGGRRWTDAGPVTRRRAKTPGQV